MSNSTNNQSPAQAMLDYVNGSLGGWVSSPAGLLGGATRKSGK